jgi:hypothetical protein
MYCILMSVQQGAVRNTEGPCSLSAIDHCLMTTLSRSLVPTLAYCSFYTFCVINTLEHLTNFKNGPVPYLGPEPVLRIRIRNRNRIRKNPKLLTESGSEINISDPDSNPDPKLDPKQICKKESYF